MRTMPQAAILTGDGRVQRCAHCLLLPQVQTTQTSDKNEQRNGPFTGCRQGCNMVFYCNDHFKGPQGIARNCPQRDWDLFHQYECGFLKLLHYVTDLSATQIQDPTLVSIYEQLEQHHREAIVNYRTKDEFEQDYCRVLMRILSLRFREMVSKEELCTVYAGQQISSTDQDLVFRPEPFASMMTLTENRESYPSEKLKGDMVDVAKILDAYQGYLHLWYQQQQSQGQGSGAGASLSRLSPDDLLGLVCREECNSFGLYAYPPGGDHKEYLTSRRDISTNAKVGYGLGLFRFASSFNHSCSPNLYHVAYGPQFLVYAARDIEPKEELNIFYLEPGPTYRLDRLAGPHVTISDPSRLGPEQEMDQRKAALQSRRAYLEEIFHFSCTCTRCHWEESQIQTLNARILRQDGNNALQQYEPEDEKETFLRLGLLCNRSGCYGFFAPPVVANVLIEQRGWNSLFMDPNKWVCVACGALQH
ncbi:hypothetical protein BGW38_001189 [Lunasporangiospora selenospora]|uniref:SET domain-containing protein n=1 Tax=Lunasporangiospora selenospora TaxID=979761 RepID=A0A9P6KEF7_9FUNG|nr:hypothetical protein BGW38_001189 [Lunasporangiospora selenospora]